jgi:hypothetical protein
MFLAALFAAHGTYNPGHANPFFARGVIFILSCGSFAAQMNQSHLRREHQITSGRFKCLRRNASWKKSSRLTRNITRGEYAALFIEPENARIICGADCRRSGSLSESTNAFIAGRRLVTTGNSVMA